MRKLINLQLVSNKTPSLQEGSYFSLHTQINAANLQATVYRSVAVLSSSLFSVLYMEQFDQNINEITMEFYKIRAQTEALEKQGVN